jgi:alcohol dehydrogenase
MDKSSYKALVVEETEQGYVRSVKSRTVEELPAGELLVRVAYSSLNYKDALSCIGNKGVTKHYPHTPGIDAAGIVEHSGSSEFGEGDAVIVTGYDLGMNTAGGFGEYIRVPAAWAL